MSSHTRASWPAQAAQAGAIVSALGSGWVLLNASKDPDEYQYLQARRLADSLTLALDWPEAWRKADKHRSPRLTIALAWPSDAKGDRRIVRIRADQNLTTEISVDSTKPAETIAKDITRRLIPSVETLHAQAIQLIAQADTAASAQRATVAAILAAEPGSRLSANSGDSVIYLGAGSHGYTLRVDSDTSVRFEPFSVDLPAALRILAALRRAQGQYSCSQCGDAINAVQVGLSQARYDGAPALCKDCVTAELTQAAHEAEDPHCTCNDCIASHAARLEAGS
jgi:hypothetical protein